MGYPLKIVAVAAFILAGWNLPALAQSGHSGAGAPIAATAPLLELSGGYTYVNLEIPGASRVTMNGADASIVANMSERWGATLDTTYTRTGDVLSTGHAGSVFTILGGPVFYPVNSGNHRIFLRGLVGTARVDAAVPTGPTTFLGGEVSHLAYAIGGGVEYDLSRRFAVRAGPDYLHTVFADATGQHRGQNNVRAVISLVFKLK